MWNMIILTENNFRPISGWIEIEYRQLPEDMRIFYGDDSCPCFVLNGKLYYMHDFVRCHNNPWGNMDVPEWIHGYDSTNYFNPVFIRISESGDYVKVYEYIRLEE